MVVREYLIYTGGTREDDDFIAFLFLSTPSMGAIFMVKVPNGGWQAPQVVEVVDHYAIVVEDEYNEDSWTIRALDANGNLFADKLFGGEVRIVE